MRGAHGAADSADSWDSAGRRYGLNLDLVAVSIACEAPSLDLSRAADMCSRALNAGARGGARGRGATNRRASGAESSRRREAFLFVILKGKREVLLLNIFPCHSMTMHASTSVNVMSMICSRA